MVWDTDWDKAIDRAEFNRAFRAMNLDGVAEIRSLEMSAYLYRNLYIVCRPYSGQVLYSLDQKEEEALLPLQNLLKKDSVN